jgi:hypothetical protein
VKTTNIDKIPPGPEFDALVAEKVMGWKNVHRHGASKGGKATATLAESRINWAAGA